MNLLYLLFPLGCAIGFVSCWRWVVEPLRREVQDSDEKLVRVLKSEDDLARENRRMRNESALRLMRRAQIAALESGQLDAAKDLEAFILRHHERRRSESLSGT